MKKSNGEMVEPEEILEVLARHWEELGKSRSSCRGDGSRRESPDEEALIYLSGSQLGRSGWGCEDVVRRGKAPGPDGALNENVNVMVDVGW